MTVQTQVQTQQYEQDLTAGDTVVEVEVGGTVDGEMTRDPVGYGNYAQAWESMVSMRIQNTGSEEILDPWVHVDGQPLWRSVDEILASIITPQMDEAHKARAIWDFARQHRYHSTTGDDEVKDTVKMLNVYGYTLCWDEAYTVANLWQAAGLKVRRGLPHGHCTTEVYYDGAYHLLDSDEHLMVLNRDNQTVASEHQISDDHDLMKRSHAYGILSPERRETVESAASLFCHRGPRSGGRKPMGDHQMQVRLRPGESLEWGWQDRGKYHGYGDHPPRSCNGRWRWDVPVLDLRWATSSRGVQPEDEDQVGGDDAQIIYDLHAPYALVGGRLSADISGDVSWSISRGQSDLWEPITADGGQGLSLDPHLAPDTEAVYHLRIRLEGNNWRLRSLGIEADLQMAPLSLPSLRVGVNQVHYCDRSPQRQIRLTCQWLERRDWHVPASPEGLQPSQGTIQAASRAELAWQAVEGADDYHLRLGVDLEADQALSPVFDKLLSRTASAGETRWTVPEEGLLNPATDYYWKVRARSAQGVWGPWSQIAHFRLQAPGFPLAPALVMDWDARQGMLRWQPNPQGAAPAAYEIHGSNERGFSARREPYEIYLGNETEPSRESVPANLINLIEAVPSPELHVLGADVDARLQHSFYRIVAIDADGVRSGPSEMVESPRPFLTTQLPRRIPADQTTKIRLDCLRSRGQLRARSNGPHRYVQAFRDADRISFGLEEGPAWIELDSDTGMLCLSPPATGSHGNHTVTLRISNDQGGTDVMGFDVDVVTGQES
ncbi:MAG: hypothetical protein HN712_17325 [Gemmatimonadetes bacterium]|nr:hypothetical protein [Gemmatimonadota bacterium]MBT6144897.1 hypothetical protein [Gemmatimonadota bacterium]MBT7862081.1 hypothetical protein [Gemmatimonadota bacterium]